MTGVNPIRNETAKYRGDSTGSGEKSPAKRGMTEERRMGRESKETEAADRKERRGGREERRKGRFHSCYSRRHL